MARQGLRVIDSDIHVTEPSDLWEKYIEPAYKDRAPQFAVSPSQPGLRWRFEGKAFPAFMDLPERQRLAECFLQALRRLGTATIEPAGRFPIGFVGTWTITIVIGDYGIDDGGSVFIARRQVSDAPGEDFDDFPPRRSRRARILLLSILGVIVAFFLVTLFASIWAFRWGLLTKSSQIPSSMPITSVPSGTMKSCSPLLLRSLR